MEKDKGREDVEQKEELEKNREEEESMTEVGRKDSESQSKEKTVTNGEVE